MKEYLKTSSDVMKELNTGEMGLSVAEAEKRLERYGKNRLQEGKKPSLLMRFLKEISDPMTIILIVAAVISGITAVYSGESFADVIIIMLVVVINAVLGVLQESKAEKAIAALREITAATSKVIRDGKQTVIKSEELVPGDIVVLEAGDAVPADCRILESASMKIEEAPLTGESVPSEKISDVISAENNADVPLGDRKNMAYMGCTVVYGRGSAVVVSTGMNTEMGKIADALTNAKDGSTPLQIKLAQLSKVLTFLVLGICAAIFVFDLVRLGSFTAASLIDTFMVAVSLAVAAIPEGLAAVVTIVLSMGVTKMSKRNAVIRKLTAVETLGCAQIICSDKTGTLTQNKMTVVKQETEDEKLLAVSLSLCSDAYLGEDDTAVGEPTEAALVNYAFSLGLRKEEAEKQCPRVGELPFDSIRKMMSTLHKRENGYVQFTKGAPDEVLKNCSSYWKDGQELPLDDSMRDAILKKNKSMADSALRVLAGAMRSYTENPGAPEEKQLCFLGLVGMIDPVRPEVRDAIVQCQHAGIRPIMITGDHRDTAAAIALELGIISDASQAITGADIDAMGDEEFERRIEEFSVYARVQPEHKVKIVQGWQKKGKITAMTGDGVNDAPSIKNADIGIGMGITGTDVTKNVADMVLADDNFATIVSAVGEGRRIYDNIRKSIQFLLASNLSEVVAIFTATIFGFTILKPVHLLWINLITDCFPALALGMEAGEEDVMERPPRDPKEGIFAGGLGFDVAFQGVLVALITLLAYFVGHFMESGNWEVAPSADGMTMAFLTLSMAEIFHSFNMRSRRHSVFTLKKQNLFLWGAMALSLILTTAVIYIPFLSEAFSFEHISAAEYFTALGLAFTVIPIVELVKLIQRKRKK